jgi:hypothetical protein
MNYDWGPWIEHDGNGCPAKGEFVHAFFDRAGRNLETREWTQEAYFLAKGDLSPLSAWLWSNASRVCVIIRYRVRRPLVSEWLAETTSDLPVTEDA